MPNGNATPADGKVLHLAGDLAGTSFRLEICDLDVLAALDRFELTETAIETLLAIGARATNAASTSFDIRAVRQELETTAEHVKGALQQCNEQVLRSIGQEGPLAQVLSAATKEVVELLRSELEIQTDPEGD